MSPKKENFKEPCPNCGGDGEIQEYEFVTIWGREPKVVYRPCYYCNGKGTV